MTDGPIDTDLQDELTLRLWDGDDSVKGELILAWAGKLESAINREFPALRGADAEDVVAESIRRFWDWRTKYDPEKAKILTVLYRIAVKVASEYRSGKYNWQKIKFQQVDDPIAVVDQLNSTATSAPVEPESEPESRFLQAVKTAFESLPELQQDILQAYADADVGDYKLDAAALGLELGHKHKGGVPIPAVTIRGYKKRAKEAMQQKLSKAGYDLKKMGYTNG